MFLSIAGLITFLTTTPIFTVLGFTCSLPASSYRGEFLYSTNNGRTWRESNGENLMTGDIGRVVCDNGQVETDECIVFSSFNLLTNYDCCMPVNCINGGSCYRGLCQCPPIWTGTSCETRMSLKKSCFFL